uniref:Uncharacterized protein n=1 Tax=Aegilops tauschii subsp. strangulata TaxID=200361 RepID=A0A453CHS4_AEGTS
ESRGGNTVGQRQIRAPDKRHHHEFIWALGHGLWSAAVSSIQLVYGRGLCSSEVVVTTLQNNVLLFGPMEAPHLVSM